MELFLTAPLGPTFVGYGRSVSGRLLRRLRSLVPRSWLYSAELGAPARTGEDLARTGLLRAVTQARRDYSFRSKPGLPAFEAIRTTPARADVRRIWPRRRSEWFQKPDRSINVLWWIPAGEIPTLADAVKRLDYLNDNGPSDHGWSLTKVFPKPT